MTKMTTSSGAYAGANFVPGQMFVNGVSKVVFTRGIGSGEHIFAMNTDGSGATDISASVSTSYCEWGPVGAKDNQVVFSFNRAGAGVTNIWKMNADGTNPVQLNSLDGLQPDWRAN